MPVELPRRLKRPMDRLGQNKPTILIGIIIGLAAVFLLGIFVDFGAWLS